MSMPPIGTAHFLFHDRIIRHSGTRLLLHVLVARANCLDLRLRIRFLPAPSAIGIRIGVAVIRVDESRDQLEGDPIIEGYEDDLTICADVRTGVGLLD